MNKIVSLILLGAVSVNAGNLAEAFSNAKVDGYLRATYQSHDIKNDAVYEDDALGGKLHFETAEVYGVTLGASFYTSNAIINNENKGLVPLRGESHKSYSILGEAYVKSEFGKNILKLGRQEIETPFAQTDDIGMVSNTFEAAMFESYELENTKIVLGQIQKMAGVDAEVVDTFTKINGSKNVQVVGVVYEGIPDVTLSGWYYSLKDAEVNKIAYLELDYEKELEGLSYGIGLQYAKQDHSVGKSANVYGATASISSNTLGVTLTTAYTEAKENSASSGFGGGPFFSNSEYLILDNAGKDAKAIWYGMEYNAEKIGLKALTFGLGRIALETQTAKKASELDFTASYEMSETAEVHLVASKLKGENVGEDDAKHLRIFANYNF